ncbi:unnamed protein product [Notodromas monacha]|uniref:Uncharacterized protein n=1 Tax=Notodromas monacha TaxID=399045 RepID=A0A7R9GE28_9CRUS|nr:unnamed protein product [Notodromas monacha]CAG0919328.1 unnamed protein product [Notodromas monacha]
MKNRGSGFLMVEGPPTQIPNGTLNAGAEGPAPRRGYDARQKELDQLLEGMLCDVQDIPDLKSEFRPHVDIDSIPTELSKVCLPLVSSVRSNRVVNGKDSRIVLGSYAPSRHHSMRDEYLRSRVPRAKPAPNDVDPEWASLLMKEFEPVTRRHNERTRAHSESRGPFLPGVSAEDFAFSDFDSPPAASIPSQPHRHPGIGYGSNQPVERKDSLDSQSLSKYFNGPRSQSSEPSVSHHSDFIEYSDLDGFAAESNSFSLHPTPPQHYVAEKRMYDPIDMWEPSPAQSMTWLQKQQQKLRERREARYRSERSPQEIQLISELKGVQSRMKVANVQNNSVGSSRDAPRPAETQQVTQPLAIKVNFSDDLKRGSSPARSLQSEPEATKPAAIRMKRTPSQSSYDRQRSQDSAKSFDELDALEQSILRAQQCPRVG